jgi:hypothetical protein
MMDVISSAGLMLSKATATSNTVFHGRFKTISTRNIWLVGWLVGWCVTFFVTGLSGGESGYLLCLFLSRETRFQVWSVDMFLFSDSVFVMFCFVFVFFVSWCFVFSQFLIWYLCVTS